MASISKVPGPPTLALAAFDLGDFGYAVDECFLGGQAAAYRLAGPATSDGLWAAEVSRHAPFTTRLVAVRPIDPDKFNGTVVVEWLNVSAGFDAAADWSVAHRHLMREGFAWVGVSAQAVGVEGGASLSGPSQPLKQVNPERYGALSHPGDAFAYDIFAQAGQAVRTDAAEILSGLEPRRLIGAGESQSAVMLTTYVNAVEPIAQAFDGFLVHSRYSASAALEDGQAVGADLASLPNNVRFRTDRRALVLTVITETDLVAGRLGGYWSARQPVDAKLRVWEVAGTAHADNYLLKVAALDSGEASIEQLAAAWEPTSDLMGFPLDRPINFAPQHHYVVQAAFASLDRWLRTGEAPPTGALLTMTNDQLPPSMRVFRRETAPAPPKETTVPPPTIAFPPNGTVVPLPPDSAKDHTIVLKADGGREPLTWLVNGQLIGNFDRFHPVLYTPDGEGLARITVVDSAGRSDTSQVRFKKAKS